MATLDPRSPAFWVNEEIALWAEFEPLVSRALLAGAKGGSALLPAEALPLVDMDRFNQAALRYLREYRLSTVKNIGDTSRDRAIEAINDWMQSGEHLDKLTDRLQKLVYPPSRAEAIAVTEVTRVMAEGNMQLWESAGVVTGKQWLTAFDERVCPICGPMHGTIVELENNWNFTPEMRANSPTLDKALNSIKQSSFRAPPAHVNCRCYLQPVILELEDPAELAERRFDRPPEMTGPVFANYDEARKWAEANANLTQDQADAIRLYTGDDRERGYRAINSALYSDIDGQQIINFHPELQRSANTLSSALQEMPRYNGKVYRGVNFSFGEGVQPMIDDFTRAMELGEPARMPAFTSTTPSDRTAKRYTSKRNGILFEIESKDGRAIASHSAHKREKEVLFNRDSAFNVLSVGKDKSGFMRVVLEQVL